MLESLQFESEPWTAFYTAGEIIRELRKASGKQNKYGSEGDKAHSDNVIDHDDRPRNVGDPAPECGDEAEFKMFGCGSAIAISSLATEFKGKNSTRKHLAFKHFLGVPYAILSFHMRNMQEGMFLSGGDVAQASIHR